MSLLDRLVPRTFQARLAIGFAGVVAIALLIVSLSLPRLLDDYLDRQGQADLDSRATIAANLVLLRLDLGLDLSGANRNPDPIFLPTDPPQLSPQARAQFGDPNDRSSLLWVLADEVGKADVSIQVAPDANHPGTAPITIGAAVSPSVAASGEQRDQLVASASVSVADTYYSQTSALAPRRLVTVRLSDPYTFRELTVQTVAAVLFTAAAVALLVAMVLSLIFARRLTSPLRRLTEASRRLAEGDLRVRVGSTIGGPREAAEVGHAFDLMAARLQESIELMRRDRDRSREFLADVSHELRTPIAALRTFNELLTDGAVADPATREEFLASMGRQIERLDWLAQNLLELSKLDSGLIALDLRPDDLRAVVESAVEQAEQAAARHGLTLTADLPPGPLRQRHDPPRLGQVLNNLVGNAIKFTPAGGHVALSLRPVAGGAEIRVADDGPGIPASELPHVFERFYRGARDSELRASGSGLGLAIVRSIVEMHGGRVTIESAIGHGTEVIVFLPRDVTDPSSPASNT